MAALSLSLSDGLTELSAQFADYEHEPRILQPEDARTLRACIHELRRAARNLENEVSRHRWNEQARRERAAGEAIVAEATRPGTNLRLFPVIPRPFSDGRPGSIA